MPRSEPLSPPLLAAAATVAALPAAWLALALDALLTGAIGAAAGFEWSGLALTRAFMPRAVQQLAGSHSPLAWAVVLLAGPLVAAVLAFLLHALAEELRAPAWLRVLLLEAAAFALLRVPALLVAGVASRGGGTGGGSVVGTLYARLGEPQTGRWSIALLALVALAGAAAILGRRAVAAGRGWMRVDGAGFRRRLARILVGYPSLIALAAWSVAEPWSAPVWMAVWLGLNLTAIHVLVS